MKAIRANRVRAYAIVGESQDDLNARVSEWFSSLPDEVVLLDVRTSAAASRHNLRLVTTLIVTERRKPHGTQGR